MNILAFFAHPDDETILAGGSLAYLSQCGARVHYLCATRGEGGEVGEPPLCQPEDLGALREREMRCAVQALGGASLTFLDYIDPIPKNGNDLQPYTSNRETLVKHVIQQIRDANADVLITHGSNGEYGHPAHILTHQASKLAVTAIRDNPPYMYTVSADFPDHPRPRLSNQNDPAQLVLDVRSIMHVKAEAALCYHTQQALFVRRSSKDAGRILSVPEVLMQVESLHRALPSQFTTTDDPLSQWVQALLIN